MAFCSTYPLDGPAIPDVSVGSVGLPVTITCNTSGGSVAVTYPTVIIDGNGTSPKQWFAANLVGANEFGLSFLSSGGLWNSTALAAAPAIDSIGGTEFVALNSNSSILCRSGFLYKPACVDAINTWLQSSVAIAQIGTGWRVATQTDFEDLEAAVAPTITIPVTTTNSNFKFRATALYNATTNPDGWITTSPAEPLPVGVTLNYAGFNAYASGVRQPGGASPSQKGRLTAWWLGPSSPGGTDNKFGVNTKSVSIWYNKVSAGIGTMGLRYNTSTVLEVGTAVVSNDPLAGNSIRLVRDWSDPDCSDLTTVDALNPLLTYDSVTFDQTVYPSIWIGAQKWVAANFADTLGGSIPYVENQAAWSALTTSGYTYYNAGVDPIECVNGYLYNFWAAEEINAYLVSIGSLYRLPVPDDLNELANYLGGASVAGGKLKSANPTLLTHWNTPNTGADNSSGFSAVGAGIRSSLGIYSAILNISYFWQNLVLTPTNSSAYQLANSVASVSTAVSQDKNNGFSVRLVIPSVKVTIAFSGPCAGTNTVTATGEDSGITDTGTSGFVINVRNGENVIISATPDSPCVVGSINVTSGVGDVDDILGGALVYNFSDAITITVEFTNPVTPTGCDPCTFSELNTVDYTYGQVTVNSVCYPTLEIGNLEVTTYNLTIKDLATLFPGVPFVSDTSGWTDAVANDTPACAFWNWTDVSTSSNSGDCARGLLFNWYAIEELNTYLNANNPAEGTYSAWRVLTECDAKHIKNALALTLNVGCPATVTFGALGSAAGNIIGNQSDQCLNGPSTQLDPLGLGAAMMSATVDPLNGNQFANNSSGYTLVETGFITLGGGFAGALNSNIWTSTSADKQYNTSSILNGLDKAWRAIAVDMDDGDVTVVDSITNELGQGFAIRLCRTKIEPYYFYGTHASSLDTGVLEVGQLVAPGTESIIQYSNAYGPWRINKCEHTVNGVTARAGIDSAPGWDKLNSPLPGTGDPFQTGSIIVRFSGTPLAAGTFTWSLPIGCNIIDITRGITTSSGTITDLDCTGASSNVTGVIAEGIDTTGISFSIDYFGGNGGPYAAQSIDSTGVVGITATLDAGNFADGDGTLTYNLSGIPDSGGTAAFALVFPGPNSTTVECTVLLDITPVIIITSLGCDSATYSPDSPPFYTGTSLNQTVTISYTASQFGSYAGETFTSTNYPGLTVTLNPATVTSSGSFTGILGGVPTVAGTAYFTICVGGYQDEDEYCCILGIPIEDAPATGGELDCDNAVITNGSSLLHPGSYGAIDNITISVPYTAGNGGAYPNLSFNSNGALGVAGLNMYAPAGNFAGDPVNPTPGIIVFTITGSPTSPGNAVFNITIGGYSCQISIPVTNLPGDADLDCGAATTSSQVLSGQSVDGITLSIPYTNGNGGSYGSQLLTSTPAGVTAILLPGVLAEGDGTLELQLSGTMPAGFVPITFQFSFPQGSPACTITLTPPVDPGTADLDCESLNIIGSVTYPDAIPVNNPIQLWLNYTNSNGGSYGPSTFNSVAPGVGGLVATLAEGQFAEGSGFIQLLVTGTPQSSGNAIFNIIVGGSECVISIPIEAPPGDIDTLDCSPNAITVVGTLTNGSPAAGVSFTIPYYGSNGGTYPANSANSINIVTGLTADLAPGLFNQPNGTVTYTVTGTPLGSGPATFPITVANQSCIVLLTVDPIPGTADLDCANATFSATPVQGFSTSITGNIPYTNGNGGFYDAYTDTVSGLTLTINSGYFNVGDGSVPFSISGTAAVSGSITFTNIQVGDQTCNLTITVSEPPPIIDDLLCDQAVISGWLVLNEAASGVTITIPYNGSNEQPYPEDSSNSTGIPGLVATTPAGTLTDPTGVLVYTVTGTPFTTGVATFTITIGTKTCVISIPVNPDNFFGPENPSPCQEVTYTDPGCEVLTDTCTILFNGTEVIYSTISTTDPCQVSFQVPCDTEPNSVAEVTFLDCEDNIITTEDLPIGDVLPTYLVQTSGCPSDQLTIIDTGCTYISQVDNIEVCSTLGCVPVDPATINTFNNPPLPCSISFNLPAVIPVASYPATVQVVLNGVSGELISLDFELQNCGTAENSFDPIDCALPGDEVTFTNPGCDLVNPDLTSILVDGVSATITDINTTSPCSVSFVLPVGAGPGPVDIQFFDVLGNLFGTETYSIAAEGVGSLYTVTFTPNSEGCHRIYFRTTQEEYCYYQAEGPFEIGVPVTVTIDLQNYAECLVTVPPTSCETTITVSGYIQPCCNAGDTLDNRVELNCVQYTATDCGLYSVECLSSNCGSFTKSTCFASGCTGLNDLTEYAFRGNETIPNDTVYVCAAGNGVQNTPNSTYTITKLSSVNATVYGENVLLAFPFGPTNWGDNGGAEWNPVGVCTFTGDTLYVPEGTSTGTSTTNNPPGAILTNGTVYEFSFIMQSTSPTTITFSSGIGNTLPVICPGGGGTYPSEGTTYQITAQNGRLVMSIPSVAGGTCFQLLSLRAVNPNVRSTCCTCYGGEVNIAFPEEGPYSIDVYYTQCTEDGPQIATATLTNTISIVSCCVYGSIFPVNKFDIQYITSIVYLSTSGC